MAERIVQQPPAQSAQEKFSDLPTAEIERSTFDMSHPWKGTMDTNNIVPCYLTEILPGDTFNVKSTVFMRLATPLKPIMDGITADIHYFFVPNRIVWRQWVNFMGESNGAGPAVGFNEVPKVKISVSEEDHTGTLADYFGLPIRAVTGGEMDINCLPFRAYAQIYNDWYRNQNLEGIVLFDDGDEDVDIRPGQEAETLNNPKLRHKRGDYFTRALPYPQKGEPVFLPLGTHAPIVNDIFQGGTGVPEFILDGDPNNQLGQKQGGDAASADFSDALQSGSEFDSAFWQKTGLMTDLTNASAATVNEIRTAFQIQRMLEREARSGTRYIEIILSKFNVQSPDFRLQRAEFLGGGSARIVVNPVAATVASEDAPQANLAAVGTGLVKGNFNHSFTEHGYVMGLISCRADLTYQDGVDRHWSRNTKYDFYDPALSHLGEQAILNKELAWTGFEEDDDIWGYQERFAEYRYTPGKVTGLFRSAHSQSLDVWHLAQDMQTGADTPPLDIFFVKDVPPIDRVVAVPSEPDLIVDIWHDVQATRPMPIYAVPGMIDHF